MLHALSHVQLDLSCACWRACCVVCFFFSSRRRHTRYPLMTGVQTCALPISLEHIPRNLVEASHDLGASPLQTFWRVILPLSIPGVLAGATFAFVLSLGDFLAPLLLGGPSGIMVSNIVVSLFGAAYNWPLGAAISLCMLALVISLLFLSESLEKKWSFR